MAEELTLFARLVGLMACCLGLSIWLGTMVNDDTLDWIERKIEAFKNFFRRTQ